MKTSDGSFHQCYNGQAVVDSRAQVIVAAELSDQAPDAEQLEPALDQLDENLDAIDAELPDGAALTRGRRLLLRGEHPDHQRARPRSVYRDRPLQALRATSASAQRGPIPEDATPKQRMARKLKTKKGHAVYARRKAIVEPVFGQMDTVQDASQLLLRGSGEADSALPVGPRGRG